MEVGIYVAAADKECKTNDWLAGGDRSIVVYGLSLYRRVPCLAWPYPGLQCMWVSVGAWRLLESFLQYTVGRNSTKTSNNWRVLRCRSGALSLTSVWLVRGEVFFVG